jgi:uncharacterized protein
MTNYTAFLAHERVASGTRDEVQGQILSNFAEHKDSILVFDDETGRVTDLDYRRTMAGNAPQPVGRPKLGVQAREVTLLPRHWDWLSQQSGGASAALRRLVDAARSRGRTVRERQDAAYRFMQGLCGDMEGYEEALRALYRSDGTMFASAIAYWPEDVRLYINSLLNAVAGDQETQ